MAAPVGLVTTAIAADEPRQRPFPLAARKAPRRPSFSRSCRRASSRAPIPSRLDLLDDQLVAAARGVDVDVAAADHLQPVVAGRTAPARPCSARSRPAVWARSSLSVR